MPSTPETLTPGGIRSVCRADAVRIGERLGLEGQDLDFLRYAALLHDVGKIHVKDEILQKPGKLTDEEFQKMAAPRLRG